MQHHRVEYLGDVGSVRSAMTSIHGWLSAAGPMNSTGAVFARRGASPTRSAGYAITALTSSSMMRCARALDRITISTRKVYDSFWKVQYTFSTVARRRPWTRLSPQGIGTWRRTAGRKPVTLSVIFTSEAEERIVELGQRSSRERLSGVNAN